MKMSPFYVEGDRNREVKEWIKVELNVFKSLVATLDGINIRLTIGPLFTSLFEQLVRSFYHPQLPPTPIIRASARMKSPG